MTNELQVFEFKGHDVRTIMKDGYPWWVAKDVCDVLELTNPTETLRGLDDDELTSVILRSGEQNREMNVVSEPGLYSLILRSRKPEAKEFKRWITHEVLPSIRKHGMYATSRTVEAMLNDPDTMIKTLQALKEERQARIDAERQLMEDAHKVKTFDSVMNVTDDIVDLDTMGKMLKQLGYDTGGKRLRHTLRQEGILCAVGVRKNIPKQIYIAQKYFKIIETEYTERYTGRKHINRTTYVTPKGQEWLIKRFARRQ